MTIVAGDILRTSMNFTLDDGSLYQNVYHHQRTGIGILSDAEHVAAISTWAATMYGELASQIQQSVVEGLSSVDLVEFVAGRWEVVENIGTFVVPFAPLNVNDAMPNQVSPYVLFKTARPKTVGRKFLFPMTEGSFDGSYISGTLVAALVAYADDALANIVIQVLDNLVPGVPRTGFDVWLPFALAIVTNVCGSQRRRRPGVGA